MQVTITLGKNAVEYVTGIPEEKLPQILSDVLERSLGEQVTPVAGGVSTGPTATQSDKSDEILGLLRELVNSGGAVGSSRPSGNTLSNEPATKILERVIDSGLLEEAGLSEDLMDLMK